MSIFIPLFIWRLFITIYFTHTFVMQGCRDMQTRYYIFDIHIDKIANGWIALVCTIGPLSISFGKMIDHPSPVNQ